MKLIKNNIKELLIWILYIIAIIFIPLEANINIFVIGDYYARQKKYSKCQFTFHTKYKKIFTC